MSLMPTTPNPYLEAFIVGIFYGSVVCVSSCLPYVASYIAGVGKLPQRSTSYFGLQFRSPSSLRHYRRNSQRPQRRIKTILKRRIFRALSSVLVDGVRRRDHNNRRNHTAENQIFSVHL